MRQNDKGASSAGAGRPNQRTKGEGNSSAGKKRMLPVWFFVGVILLIYGALILVSGIYELAHPPSTVLASLHPAVWWGALLALIGAVYVYIFRPGKA
jgi:hypothetical protein